MATENIFVKAKAYQKKHPRTSWADCIQKCKSKKKVSGTKTKKVAGVKRTPAKVAAVKKKTVKKAAPKVAAKTVTVRIGKIGAVANKATKIAKEIDSLEAKRKLIKGRELREINARVINAKHRELNSLKSQIR